MIRGIELSKRYGDLEVLKSVDITINPSEIVSIQPTDWDRLQAMEITENLLQSGMEVDVIFANNAFYYV